MCFSPELLYSRPCVAKDDARSRPPDGTPSLKHGGRNRIVHLLLLFVAAVIVVDALVGERGLVAMLRARKEYDELATTIARARAENSRLRDQARRLREDPATIEDLARRELGLIRPGETVFIVKDVAPASERNSPGPPADPPPPLGH